MVEFAVWLITKIITEQTDPKSVRRLVIPNMKTTFRNGVGLSKCKIPVIRYPVTQNKNTIFLFIETFSLSNIFYFSTKENIINYWFEGLVYYLYYNRVHLLRTRIEINTCRLFGKNNQFSLAKYNTAPGHLIVA